MTDEEILKLRRMGAKSITLNEGGNLAHVEFFSTDVMTDLAIAVDNAQAEAEARVVASIEDEEERKKVQAKLRESLVYASSD